MTTMTPADIRSHAVLILANALAAATAEDPAPAPAWIERPVREMQIGGAYGYVSNDAPSHKPRAAVIASIRYAGRYDRTQIIVGIDGILTNKHGKPKTHFVRHDVNGTYLTR